jgi:SAM-dependent methyltransferase
MSHEDVVRQSFERQVALFSGPESPFAARPSSTLSWIEPLDEDMIVLDVACGAAHASTPVAPHVRHVVGVDVTYPLLELAAPRVPANVSLVEGNAELLPLRDESFDVVCCRSSLHHFARPRRAVDEMARVCKADGRVVLIDLVPPGEAVRDRYDELHRLLDPSHVRTFLEPELAALLPGPLVYAETTTIRLPIDVAITPQSDRDAVMTMLRTDGPSTGFDPVEEDGGLVVSFTTSTMHFRRSV